MLQTAAQRPPAAAQTAQQRCMQRCVTGRVCTCMVGASQRLPQIVQLISRALVEHIAFTLCNNASAPACCMAGFLGKAGAVRLNVHFTPRHYLP